MKLGLFIDPYTNSFYPDLAQRVHKLLQVPNTQWIIPEDLLDNGLDDYLNDDIDLARENAINILKAFKNVDAIISLSPRLRHLTKTIFPILFKNTRWIEHYQDFLKKFIELEDYVSQFVERSFSLESEQSSALVFTYFGNNPSPANYLCTKLFEQSNFKLPQFFIEETGILPHHQTKPVLHQVVNQWVELYDTFIFNEMEAYFHFHAYCLKQGLDCNLHYFAELLED